MISNQLLIIAAAVLCTVAAFVGWSRAKRAQKAGHTLRSRPIYHLSLHFLWVAVPMLVVTFLGLFNDAFVVKPVVYTELNSVMSQTENLDYQYLRVTQVAQGLIPHDQVEDNLLQAVDRYQSISQLSKTIIVLLTLLAGFLGFWYVTRRFAAPFPAREEVERFTTFFLAASSTVAILTTLGIVLALVFETLKFFQKVPFFDFLFGTHWSPQMAIRADQAGSSGAFGVLPLLAGTFLIAIIAMLVAVPVGLFSAIYLAEYASPRVRAILKPLLEVLAGIPTVVYGFFAALTVAPLIVNVCRAFGLSASSESALAAGSIMGVMIIPFVSSLSEDVISSVPRNLREASLGLGATQSETIKQVVLLAALPGIVGALVLAFSRAIGETMIVVMAAGLAANLTANPLDSVTTITAQIVTILVGDQEFDSAKTLSAFALGFTLFCITLLLNMFALRIVRKYREAYE